MKLRRHPEDFQVTEVNTLPLQTQGPFAAYRLQKRSLTTLDALDRIGRTWGIPRRHLTHAGLKDRHAATTQTITIRGGPPQAWESEEVTLTYLGQAPRATTAQDIVSNAFRIVIRSMALHEIAKATEALHEVAVEGFANYFDDQRFGSLPPSQEFIAAAWIRGDYERALWLAFAEPLKKDSSRERNQKAVLREHWRDWTTCKTSLRNSHARSIVTYLCDHPEDFRGAWARVKSSLRGLWLSAFQSHLWNGIVSG